MIDIKIDVTDALQKLNAINLRELRQAVGVAVAEEARDRIAPYPPASGKKQPFKSAKARKFFFAALRRGEIGEVDGITVPYRRGSDPRSETLGRRWSVKPDDDGVVLTNTASYSDLVHGAGTQQAAYHKGTWKTDEGVARAIEDDGTAQRVAETVVEDALRKIGLT